MTKKLEEICSVSQFLDFLSTKYPNNYPSRFKHLPTLMMRGEPMLYKQPCSSLWQRLVTESPANDDQNKAYYTSEMTVFNNWLRIDNEINRRAANTDLTKNQIIANNWLDLARARHHSVPTRLVDFTTNPLVSLWFSCTSNWAQEAPIESGEDGFIYCVLGDLLTYATLRSPPHKFPYSSDTAYELSTPSVIKELIKHGDGKFCPDFTPKKAFFLNADGEYHPRINKQSGKFFVSIDITKTVFDYEEIETMTVKIPAEKKEHIVYELKRMGIDRISLGLVTSDSAGEFALRRAQDLLNHV